MQRPQPEQQQAVVVLRVLGDFSAARALAGHAARVADAKDPSRKAAALGPNGLLVSDEWQIILYLRGEQMLSDSETWTLDLMMHDATKAVITIAPQLFDLSPPPGQDVARPETRLLFPALFFYSWEATYRGRGFLWPG